MALFLWEEEKELYTYFFFFLLFSFYLWQKAALKLKSIKETPWKHK